MSNKLLMKITISSPGGISSRNVLYLSVLKDEHGTLIYSLRSMSGQSHSLSNLQTRCPLPTWHSPEAGTLISQIRSVLRNSVYQYDSVEYPPSAPAPVVNNTLWVITEDSLNYTWEVFATSPDECIAQFRRMWYAWCRATGAERDYWGTKCSDVTPRKVTLNTGYMDHEVFK